MTVSRGHNPWVRVCSDIGCCLFSITISDYFIVQFCYLQNSYRFIFCGGEGRTQAGGQKSTLVLKHGRANYTPHMRILLGL